MQRHTTSHLENFKTRRHSMFPSDPLTQPVLVEPNADLDLRSKVNKKLSGAKSPSLQSIGHSTSANQWVASLNHKRPQRWKKQLSSRGGGSLHRYDWSLIATGSLSPCLCVLVGCTTLAVHSIIITLHDATNAHQEQQQHCQLGQIKSAAVFYLRLLQNLDPTDSLSNHKIELLRTKFRL